MSVFREMLAADIENEFLDLDYFGEEHTVAGKPITCVVDEDIYRDSANGSEYGITGTGKVLYMRESDIQRQLEGTTLELDGCLYTIVSWRVDEGMSRVVITMPTSW